MENNRSTLTRRPRLRARLATEFLRIMASVVRAPPEDWSPIFLIGCGRSGTTILGQVFNQHREVCVANEPRHVWRAINPDTDIWYALRRRKTHRGKRITPGGKMSMTANDVTPRDASRANRLFYAYQRHAKCAHFVEKLPVNSFRIGYLKALFPNCRFVHIVRHGLEVAHSIAREGSRWYAPNNGHKWQLLTRFGIAQGYDADFLASCDTDLSKGLVEWTLSVETVLACLDGLSTDDYSTVRYDALLRDPKQTLCTIQESLNWSHDQRMTDFAVGILKRQNKKADELALPEPSAKRTHALLAELRFD